jgi:hypothetical protein
MNGKMVYPDFPDEHDFISKVEHSKEMIVTRRSARQSGGSTLVALMSFFFTMQGKQTGIMTGSQNASDHMLHSTFSNISLNGYTKGFQKSKRAATIQDLRNPNHKTADIRLFPESGAQDLLKAIRGSHYHYLFIDVTFKVNRTVLSALAANIMPGGKIVINVMP